MYEIKIVEEFSGAHNLREYKGKCESLHGHNWKVEVSLADQKLDTKGMLMDFSDLKKLLKKILEEMDHKYLNDLPFFKKENPTSENIAFFIHEKLSGEIQGRKIKVSVWETANSRASFSR